VASAERPFPFVAPKSPSFFKQLLVVWAITALLWGSCHRREIAAVWRAGQAKEQR
jgi:hypothetical protein